MGRLIDADEMLKRLEEWNTNDGIDKALYKFCVERINEQPTAYDVEKVVAELEEAFPINPYPNEFTNGRDLGIKKAIEIVRKGGV